MSERDMKFASNLLASTWRKWRKQQTSVKQSQPRLDAGPPEHESGASNIDQLFANKQLTPVINIFTVHSTKMYAGRSFRTPRLSKFIF
jgi:hypothetical protein